MIKPDTELMVLLPKTVLEETQALAKTFDVTVGFIIREALEAFLRDQRAPERTASPTCTPVTHNLDGIRSALEVATSTSRSWTDLQTHLRVSNLELRPKGGGLIVREADTHLEICKASELGFPYSRLIKRFRCGFPGHSHQWLVDRLLGENSGQVVDCS